MFVSNLNLNFLSIHMSAIYHTIISLLRKRIKISNINLWYHYYSDIYNKYHVPHYKSTTNDPLRLRASLLVDCNILSTASLYVHDESRVVGNMRQNAFETNPTSDKAFERYYVNGGNKCISMCEELSYKYIRKIDIVPYGLTYEYIGTFIDNCLTRKTFNRSIQAKCFWDEIWQIIHPVSEIYCNINGDRTNIKRTKLLHRNNILLSVSVDKDTRKISVTPGAPVRSGYHFRYELSLIKRFKMFDMGYYPRYYIWTYNKYIINII
jgi:hypothetical protein